MQDAQLNDLMVFVCWVKKVERRKRRRKKKKKKTTNNPDKMKEFQTLYVFQLWFILSCVAAINCHQSTGRMHATVISANKPADVVHRNDNVK